MYGFEVDVYNMSKEAINAAQEATSFDDIIQAIAIDGKDSVEEVPGHETCGTRAEAELDDRDGNCMGKNYRKYG